MIKIPIYGIELGKSNWMFDAFMGVILGFSFIVLNMISANYFIIGSLPDFALSLSDTGRMLVSGVVAPIVEEIAFRGALFGILLTLIGFPYIFSAFIVSAIFALYHINAYAGSLASIGAISGALFGAFSFSMICLILLKNKAWRSLLTVIIAHATFNIFLISKLVVAQ